ncbi:HET domain-containing protein [Mycena venus]|uniref:HET domain-containing protein n=1 Tax=Mycena venus TaxID=2733690 RepID=A0A8H6YL63_9AGAR|nr:HET domain-containing protein [Mycena venus]
MFNSKALLTSSLAAVLAFAAAAPAKPSPDASVTVQVCSGGVGVGCTNVPVVSDSCINLTGGLSFLNKEISTAVIPGGFICTFFQDFGCTATGTGNAGADSSVFLSQGTWNFFSVPGLSGPQNFNDLTSSFSCSPL